MKRPPMMMDGKVVSIVYFRSRAFLSLFGCPYGKIDTV